MVDLMEEYLELKLRRFKKKGWNGNGARLLSIASWIVSSNQDKVRRNFLDNKTFVLLSILILVYYLPTNTLQLLVAAVLFTYHSIEKLPITHNLEDILETLDNDKQKLLVLQMVEHCEVKKLDYESLTELTKYIEDAKNFNSFHEIILKFVDFETHYHLV